MRTVLLMCVMLLAGCSTTANIQKDKGAAEPRPAHNRNVCLLDTPLPDGVEAVYMGRGVSNSQWYGGYAGVRKVLASRARASGVDVVANMRYSQVIGFFAVVRPRIYGDAYALASPESFNCLALGGISFGPSGLRTDHRPAVASSDHAPTYDECMSRVLKIQDHALRLESMAMCDSAKK